MKSSKLAEVQWDFDGEDTNWRWCFHNATFTHQEACEFIVHIAPLEPNDDPNDPPYWKRKMAEMIMFGCSNDFVATYLRAKDEGAERILFYA